jgi:hypothetical protein
VGNRFIPPFAISLIWVKQWQGTGDFFSTTAVVCASQLILFLAAFSALPGAARAPPGYDPPVFPTPGSIAATTDQPRVRALCAPPPAPADTPARRHTPIPARKEPS